MTEIREPTIHLTVNRIKDFSFTINEGLFEEGKLIRLQFQHHTSFNEERNLVDLTLRVIYVYDITNILPENLLFDIHIQNIFSVVDLRQYKAMDEQFILPEELITAMVSLAISHARALVSMRLAGTMFQNNMIPIINPIMAAKSLFPIMFKEENIANIEEERISKLPKKRAKQRST